MYRLLESGLFADAEIHCGSRTWKVHKAVLTPQSKYFKAALLGGFVVNTRCLSYRRLAFTEC